MVERASAVGGRVIVNDRADVAWIAGAAGVHVGQDDLPPAMARAILGPDAIVGFSTHSTMQIDAALTNPLSYVAVGPVFGTTTKNTGYAAVGLDLVRYAGHVSGGLPVVAIGGITLANARSAIDAGAGSVAVISDVLARGDPTARVREFLKALGG
jgi:thiamine-phosphate pyrophosphorylase